MIGLKKDLVQIVKYNPEWAVLADNFCQELRTACQGLVSDIQHVGSTAVPNLPSKPIIDIAIAIEHFQVMPKLKDILANIGYCYRGSLREVIERSTDTSEEDHYFTRESSFEVRTVHLHVVKYRGTEWKNYIQFRDILRNDPNIRKQYEYLKLDLMSKYPNDRQSYTISKHDFIQTVLKA
jgi:GrpB-like predicted nucleotidyltransferase (UPF0157 family)